MRSVRLKTGSWRYFLCAADGPGVLLCVPCLDKRWENLLEISQELPATATAVKSIDGETTPIASTVEEAGVPHSTSDAGSTSVSVTHTYHVSELGRIDFVSQMPPGGAFVMSLASTKKKEKT